ALGPGVEVTSGPEAVAEAVLHDDVDIVVTAVVGAIGIRPTLAALQRGVRVALSNKETLVAAGHLVTEALRLGGGEIVPVDSEHGAIHQCLRGERTSDIARLILTASGGPFRTTSLDVMRNVTVDEALNHPTWKMGGKI